MDPQKSISISAELYNLIVQRIKNSEGEFNTVEEYVNFVLTEILQDEKSQTYTNEEKKEIEKNLKDLGYI